jgi:hypothetical protein
MLFIKLVGFSPCGMVANAGAVEIWTCCSVAAAGEQLGKRVGRVTSERYGMWIETKKDKSRQLLIGPNVGNLFSVFVGDKPFPLHPPFSIPTSPHPFHPHLHPSP